MSTTTTWRKGDKVIPDPEFPGLPPRSLGHVYVVDRIGPKNVVAQPDPEHPWPGARGTRFPADAYLDATPENIERLCDDPSSLGKPYVPAVFFAVGAIVTLKRASRGYGTEEPLVVIGGRDKVNVTRLGGGDGDRYLRVVGSALVERDQAWLTERLVEMA